MLIWQPVAGTSAGRLVGFLRPENGNVWYQKEAANLLCMQRDVFIFPLTPGTLAAPYLWLHNSHLTVKTSETIEAFKNSRKIR